VWLQSDVRTDTSPNAIADASAHALGHACSNACSNTIADTSAHALGHACANACSTDPCADPCADPCDCDIDSVGTDTNAAGDTATWTDTNAGANFAFPAVDFDGGGYSNTAEFEAIVERSNNASNRSKHNRMGDSFDRRLLGVCNVEFIDDSQ
jgi:hypothetical protein